MYNHCKITVVAVLWLMEALTEAEQRTNCENSYETIIGVELFKEKETYGYIYYTILKNDQRYADDCRLY